MVTTRTPINRPTRARITPEVVALWRTLRAIQKENLDETWEEGGGRRREYSDAHVAIRRALRIPIWGWSPLDADTANPPKWLDASKRDDYRRARALWLELEKAAMSAFTVAIGGVKRT